MYLSSSYYFRWYALPAWSLISLPGDILGNNSAEGVLQEDLLASWDASNTCKLHVSHAQSLFCTHLHVALREGICHTSNCVISSLNQGPRYRRCTCSKSGDLTRRYNPNTLTLITFNHVSRVHSCLGNCLLDELGIKFDSICVQMYWLDIGCACRDTMMGWIHGS